MQRRGNQALGTVIFINQRQGLQTGEAVAQCPAQPDAQSPQFIMCRITSSLAMHKAVMSVSTKRTSSAVESAGR